MKVLAGLGVATALVLGTTAPASATWSRARDVSAAGWLATDSPQVSVDRQGDALLVWEACDGSQSSCYHQVQARLKRKGQPMGALKNLSPLGAVVAWPHVDSDDDGDSAVVWEQEGAVVGPRISASGGLGPLRTLSTTSAMNPTVVMAPGGRALAAWTEYGGGSNQMRDFFHKDGSLGRVLDLGSGAADLPGIGFDRQGLVVVAWTQGNRRLSHRFPE